MTSKNTAAQQEQGDSRSYRTFADALAVVRQPPPADFSLPCVVQIGFAGPRLLNNSGSPDPSTEHRLAESLSEFIERFLSEFSAQNGLTQNYVLCGISQIAVGGDTLFTRACQRLGIWQRIFLPQHRQEYLSAAGSHGPDFNADQAVEAKQLLDSVHVIEERVVTASPDRASRFEETNLEIIRASDVVICLVDRDEDGQRSGGTRDLLDQARRRGKPAVEMRFAVTGEQIATEVIWYNRENFAVPQLPAAIASTQTVLVEDVEAYCDRLKKFASSKANWLRLFYHGAALVIVSTHILATVVATIALADREDVRLVEWLLGFEFTLLSIGLTVHWYLHNSEAVKEWAFSRLMAEVARSMLALPTLHFCPDFLFALQVPEGLKPVLRTLSVFHLRSTRTCRDQPWQPIRDAYVTRRLRDKNAGQIAYYVRARDNARFWHKWIPTFFFLCSSLAVLAVMGKLVLSSPDPGAAAAQWKEVLGVFAIALPVLAVGLLSLGASMDIEARVHVYGEMLVFLEQQTLQLEQALSRSDFLRLLIETESRLLGETASWFSRRSFQSVT